MHHLMQAHPIVVVAFVAFMCAAVLGLVAVATKGIK